MLRFVFMRLVYGLAVLLGVITLVFVLFNVLPGDPARMILGQRADMSSVEAINKDLGRDKPLFTQYLNYLNDLSPLSVHNVDNKESYWYLNPEKYAPCRVLFKISKEKGLVLKYPYMRRSYQSKRQVTEILTSAFPATALLAISAIIFAFIFGTLLGTLAAIYKDSFIDKISLVISALGVSVPSFFAAIVIAWLFAFVLSDFTGLNMIGSMYTIDDFGEGEYFNFKNLILPAITLGLRPLAIIVQLMRSSMIEVLSQDYIRTAKAKGLSFRKVVTRHAFKNALNPVITAASGWLASLLAGAVFIEYVFDWKGIGVAMVDALEKYDFPVVMGGVLFISVILIVINIMVDISYAMIDPRVKLQ
jgi:peptide/nickel transport system permease protein